MAIVDFGPFWLPHPQEGGGAPSYATTLLIDAANEKTAIIFQFPATGNVRKLGFATRTVTNGATIDVRLETVDATTGDPSGTLWSANTNVSQVIANGDDNTAFTPTMTADAAVTKGQKGAIVLANPGASFGDMTFASVTAAGSGRFLGSGNVPYLDLFAGAGPSWTKSATIAPVNWLEYSDGSYYPMPGFYPISAINTNAFNSGSGTDEYLLKFQLPHSVRVAGCWAWMIAAADFDFVLYDSDGTTALATASHDGDQDSGVTGSYYSLFSSPVTLSANTNYYLSVKPTTTTNITIYTLTFPTTNVMAQMEGGANFHLATKVDGSAPSATTTQRPLYGLLINGVEQGGGSSLVAGRHHRHLGGVSWYRQMRSLRRQVESGALGHVADILDGPRRGRVYSARRRKLRSSLFQEQLR